MCLPQREDYSGKFGSQNPFTHNILERNPTEKIKHTLCDGVMWKDEEV